MEGSVAEAEERAEAAGQTEATPDQGKPPGVEEDATRDPDAPDSVQGAVARARQKLEEEGSFLEEGDEGLDLEPAEPAAEEEATEEPEEDIKAIPERDQLPEEALPEGYNYDANNRLHRKDGSFASLDEHEQLRRQFEGGAEDVEPAEETEPGAEEEGPEPAEGDELLVELPGREPDETFEVEAADEETAERLRQLRNGHMRRQELKRQMESVEEDRRDLREVEAQIQADPASFIAEQIEDPEVQERTVLRLLGEDEELHDRVQSKIRQWDMNPDKRRADLAEMREESRERRDKTSREMSVREKARTAANQARQHIQSLAESAGLEGAAAEKFMATAMNEVGNAMVQAGRFEISQDEAIKVLEHTGTLEAFGASPGDSGASRSSSRNGASEESASERRVRAVDPDSEEARKARQAGEEMKEEAEGRRAAAASPQGAGASAAQQVSPPEGQSVEERIEWAKDKGLGAILGGQ